jgi:pyrroline-5-carboxylate reductase
MTCICSERKTNNVLNVTKEIFDQIGRTLIIDEELIIPATALAVCGIVFF